MNNVNSGRDAPLKIGKDSRISPQMLVFADSIRITDNMNQHYIFYMAAQIVASSNKANAWFLNGSVRTVDKGELAEQKLITCVYP